MKRREFIAGAGSAAAWPVMAGAQQPAQMLLGFQTCEIASPGCSGDDQTRCCW
jgi:hypothetical protein